MAPGSTDAPVEVLICGLVWDCGLVRNGGLVTHQTSKSSFSVSQWRVCCLFLAAALPEELVMPRWARSLLRAGEESLHEGPLCYQ